MDPIYKCPVCRGRIAFWAVRPEFACHHCGMNLQSNRTKALAKALGVAVSIEILFLLFLFFVLGASFTTLVIWGSAGGMFGYFGGWLTVKYSIEFLPIRRGSNSEVSRG